MTRPEIIRADSIDLQDQNAPSAQDHSRQPTQPSPLGAGPPAPHQAGALREVAVEAAEENVRSPRVSREWTNGDLQESHQQYDQDDLVTGVTTKLTGANLQQQDDLAVAQNGGGSGSTGEDADMADAEGDDGMDDDMMDKISSSPSIDDGGYPLPHLWPQRSDSLTRTPLKSRSFSQACYESSSPFVETSDHFPLRTPQELLDKDVVQPKKFNDHHLGEYLDVTGETDSNYESNYGQDILNEFSPSRAGLQGSYVEDYNQDYDLDEQSEDALAGRIEIINEYCDDKEEVELCIEENEYIVELNKVAEDEGIRTIPYESSEDEDDDYDIPYSADSRFVDSGWGGECLQESEDIDFEFVYALHTFVATVEGQANATKGDTMVLLDDSNSYWWLVRVVKDSSIGYLPAEHIETPTERLARLNKHRNIDLTSAMLGDQAEKSKNPLKKVIRRRNAKTVTFAAPTYVEASDVDYSSEEEDEGEVDYYGQNGQQEQDGDQHDQRAEESEVAIVEPLKPRAELRDVKFDATDADGSLADATLNGSDIARSSDEFFDGKMESKSRIGTVRNTDSFFKDDSVETRKITLTPNLLRDDSSTSTRTSNESKELKQRPSLDKIEKDPVLEKSKDKKDKKEKKEKEKKPGMLSGLFKRKEKKSKAIDDEIDELMSGKQSNETSRTSPSPSKDSEDMVTIEEQITAVSNQEPQRHPSKLQKQPQADISPSKKPGLARDLKALEPQQAPALDRAPPAEPAQAPSMRVVQLEGATDAITQQARSLSPELIKGQTLTQTIQKEQKQHGGAISKILRSASSSTEPKPVKAKKAKARVELDDFDTTPEDSPEEEPVWAPSKQSQRPIPGSFPDSYITTPAYERSNPADERLSESPVQVSPISASQSYPPPLMVDTSSQEDPPSPVSSPSPELIDAEDICEKKAAGSTASTSTSSWSDSHLRTFFDDDADIKDLLVVVYDKSEVVPAGPDHPITGNLFREENAKLADITNRLDGMLGDWLARKMRTQSSR